MAPKQRGERAGSADSALTDINDVEKGLYDGDDGEVQRNGKNTRKSARNGQNQSAAETGGLPKRNARGVANGKGKNARARQQPSKTPDIQVPDLDELENGHRDYDVDEELEEEEDEVPTDDENDEDFNFKAPAPKGPGKGGKRGPARAAATKGKGKGRATYAEDDDEEERPVVARTKDDFEVAGDNSLFNAVKNPNAALESSVEDWVAQYGEDEDTRGEALAQLITFVLRTCGCNSSVDKHEAVDLDGVVDRLDEIQNDFSKANQASYPLVSKSKGYKKFRASLADLFEKLVEATDRAGILYDDWFCETLQAWLVAASSSRLRAFRHTSTVLALQLVEALCEISVEAANSFATLQRQREAEAKKKKVDKARVKAFDTRVGEAHDKKVKLDTYFKDIFDAVFVHRYRDAESSIRIECIKSLGAWMRMHPEYFLEGAYLRYIGWTLTDLDKEVRLAAVTALAELYKKEDYIASMNNFTERFKGRLVEMAVSEAELSVRCAAIHVLGTLDKLGLLDDDQKDEVGRLIFDDEQRVRRAASPFFAYLLEEAIAQEKTQMQTFSMADEDEGLTAAQKKEKEELHLKRMRFRCLAGLLVNYDIQTDERANRDESQETASQSGSQRSARESSVSSSAGRSIRNKRGDRQARNREGDPDKMMQIAAILSHSTKDKVTLAVEAMWHDIKLLQDWNGMLEYVLLDHSSGREGSSRSTTPVATNGTDSDTGEQVEDDCRLDDEEENMMLNVLVAAIATARHRASLLPTKDKAEAESLNSDITRALIKHLPRLFTKHQSDMIRSSIILLLPKQMQIDLYLDTRQTTLYESLWADVTKQFTSSTNLFILERAMETIQHLRASDSLSQIAGEKVAALERAVTAPIFEVAATAEITTGLDADDLKKVEGGMTRLALISKNWDPVMLLEEKDGGNMVSLIDIAVEILERAAVGTAEENNLIQQVIELMSTYLLWKMLEAGQTDSPTPRTVAELRTKFVQQLSEYSLDRQGVMDVTEPVKRASLKALLDLCIVSQQRHSVTQAAEDLIELSVEQQYRADGLIQAEIERYGEMVRDSLDQMAEDDLIYESDGENDNAQKKPEGAEFPKKYRPLTPAQQAAEYAFNDLISSFTRAICTEVIDLHHASTVLAHYDSLGPFYDECCNQLALALRHYGVLGDAADSVAGVVYESLKQSLETFLTLASRTEKQFLSLARQLSNHIVVRKGFTISQRLASDALVKIHNSCIKHVASKLATFESQERGTSRNRALVMFKGLNLCTASMNGKEAAAVHGYMTSIFKQYNILPSTASKHWEPYRAYDRKLVSLMSKDSTIKAAARKQAKTSADAEDLDDDFDEANNVDDDGARLPGRQLPRPRPAAKAKAKGASKKADKPVTLPSRKSARTSLGGPAQYIDEGSDVDEDANELMGPPRGRPGKQNNTSSSSRGVSLPSRDYEGGDSDDDEGSSVAEATAGLPKRRNKRPRETSPMAQSERSSSPPEIPSQSRLGMSSGNANASQLSRLQRQMTPQMRDDDLESLAGVPDSPPDTPLSQIDDLDHPSKRMRF